jgi:peptide/nickel transport system substrate-binding protein
VPGQIPSSKTFTVAWTATDPASMDPHVCTASDCMSMMRVIYEPLVGWKYGVTEIEGRLAEEWETSTDGLTWTFTLHEGHTFSDGSPVTPEDVVYSFDRLIGIGKGPAFLLGDAYAGAEVVDAKTVTIKLKNPIGPFQYNLPRIFIVNSTAVKEHVTDDDPWGEKWLYDHSAGSGAFMFEAWEHAVQVSAIKNPNYWDPEWPKVERFVILQVPERATDRLLLEKGEVDTVLNPVLDHIPDYEANPDICVSTHDSLITMQLMMSQIVPPLDDVRVRKAVALSFDYQAMVDGVYRGYAVQAQGNLARGVLVHNFDTPISQKDTEQAKALLAEAGYPDGGFDLELLIVQGQPYGIGASQILQQGLAEIGVNLKIVEQSWATLAGRMHDPSDPPQMYVLYGRSIGPDPDIDVWSKWHTSQQGGGSNGIYWGDDETDALLETGRFSTDQAEREAAYKELQRRLVEDHAAVWLVNPKWISVRRCWVKNYDYDQAWDQTFRADRYILEGKP